MSVAGPLGELRGMTYDPVRNRYFPTPKDVPRPLPPRSTSPIASGSGSSTPVLPRTKCLDERGKSKRVKFDDRREARSVVPSHRLPAQRRMQFRARRDLVTSSDTDAYASFSESVTLRSGSCGGEKILSFKSCAGGSFWATTDHGKVIFHRQNGDSQGVCVCAANILGLHYDLARMVMVAISSGSDPHVHCFARRPEAPESLDMHHQEAHLYCGDVHAVSSFDDVCNLGATHSMLQLTYHNGLKIEERHMPSDVMALHQAERNIVFAGMRSGVVSMEDTRVAPKGIHRVGGTRKGKAIIGVKRLQDSAVPWGLLVSGMRDELLVYDIRYSRQPLLQLQGHVNAFQPKLGLATSPDDTHVFAAGSDKRIRLWHLPSGERVRPLDPPSEQYTFSAGGEKPGEAKRLFDAKRKAHQARIGPYESNPLRRIFADQVETMSVRDDKYGLDITVGGEIQRFSTNAHDEALQVSSDEGEDSDYDYLE